MDLTFVLNKVSLGRKKNRLILLCKIGRVTSVIVNEDTLP